MNGIAQNTQSSIGRVEVHYLNNNAYRVSKNGEILGDITMEGPTKWRTSKQPERTVRNRRAAIESLIKQWPGVL